MSKRIQNTVADATGLLLPTPSRLRVLGIVGMLALTGGCSMLSGDDAAQPVPGEEGAYPSISSVPEQPPAVTPAAERDALREGLVAGREQARYAGDQLRAGPVEEAPPPASAAPAMAAAPTEPVAATPTPALATERVTPTMAAAVESARETSGARRSGAVPPVGEPVARSRPRPAAAPPMPFVPSRSMQVATLYFYDASSALTGRHHAVLRQVAALARQQGGRVRVVGHASSRTQQLNPLAHERANYQVSLNRATRVARALRRLGVPEASLAVDAVSDAQPLYYESMPSGEAGNRRADIFLDF